MKVRGQPRVTVLFGTRPEAIKLGPVVLALRAVGFDVHAVSTGQHQELASDVLPLFDIVPEADLELMRPSQTLDYVLGEGVQQIGAYLSGARPSAVVVQGDTSSTLAASLAAFHHRIPIGHVEAGLRTWDMEFPFPEEMNRRVTSVVARWHFAPTPLAARNLARDGITERVHMTGNTVVDAVRQIVGRAPPLSKDLDAFTAGSRYILATAHRRESWGEGIANIATALRTILDGHDDLRLVFVTHPNPQAQGPVNEVLDGHPRVLMLNAVVYPVFLRLLTGATMAVSDSGGVQEEGATLGIPVAVTRAITERPEGVEAGAVELVGTDVDRIVAVVRSIVDDPARHRAMALAGRTLYGDGRASERIAEVLAAEVAG